jgi:hypothetical protein
MNEENETKLYEAGKKLKVEKALITKMINAAAEKAVGLGQEIGSPTYESYLFMHVNRALKIASTKPKPEAIEGIIIGDAIKDWGDIQRKSNKGDKDKKGKFIPEHSYQREYVFVPSNPKIDVIRFQQRSETPITSPPQVAEPTKAIVNIAKNYKGTGYYFDDANCSIELKSPIGYEAFKSLVQNDARLQKHIVKELKDLMDDKYRNAIVKDFFIINVRILEIRSFKTGNSLITFDDDSTAFENVIFKIGCENVNFIEEADGVIFVANAYIKSNETKDFSISSYMSIPKESDKAKEVDNSGFDEKKESSSDSTYTQ